MEVSTPLRESESEVPLSVSGPLLRTTGGFCLGLGAKRGRFFFPLPNCAQDQCIGPAPTRSEGRTGFCGINLTVLPTKDGFANWAFGQLMPIGFGAGKFAGVPTMVPGFNGSH